MLPEGQVPLERVRGAASGTLLIDEPAALTAPAQRALVRALAESEARLVCATQRELGHQVNNDELRADLAARCEGHTLHLLPLRERREDLGLVVASLLRRLAGDDAGRIGFTGRAARRLLQHPWRGNVRELETRLLSALGAARDGTIDAQHLALPVDSAVPAPVLRASSADERARNRSLLEQLMCKHQGSIHAVARALGRDRVQIRRWVKAWGIDPDQFRPKSRRLQQSAS
jgi:DNA-binding NtrC family response regulator